jgi:hypothetical protein
MFVAVRNSKLKIFFLFSQTLFFVSVVIEHDSTGAYWFDSNAIRCGTTGSVSAAAHASNYCSL